MAQSNSSDLKAYIRSIPDFPKPGILFRDITPLLGNAEAFAEAIRQMADAVRDLGIQQIAAAEARGFLFASALALELGTGLVPIRKPGKLPYDTISHSYDLEYGTDTLQIHADAVQQGAKVLVVDDLLATGGTIDACCKLVEKAGGIVAACLFLVELVDLGGAGKIENYNKISLIRYEGA
ncbi:MAG: adenine phosphoribosyltransferase [Planctomycetaceae bacterium]|nr:adenine phosphoribosyltransferase [Planctomycetaceae bacterium]